MIRSSDLTFNYNSENSFAFPDVSCENGNDLLILGHSGSGKTTLLHLLAGILKPTAGSLVIDDQNVTSFDRKKMDGFRGRNIGIIYQKHHFFSSLNMLENITLPSAMSNIKIQADWLTHLLDVLGLENKCKKKPQSLSEGELQRASIARALVLKPKLILADEPTSSLDDNNCEIVIQLLQRLNCEVQSSLIIVTHDQRLKSSFSTHIILERS